MAGTDALNMAFGEDIQKSGHGLGGAALEPTSATTVVRVRDGKLSTTDGPFIETKEQLGGYYLIEAKADSRCEGRCHRSPADSGYVIASSRTALGVGGWFQVCEADRHPSSLRSSG